MLEKLSALNKKQLIIGAVSVCFIAAGWHIYNNLSATPTITKEPPLVKTITIGKTDISQNSSYPGEVRGRYESSLSFQVTGKINARYVNIGDKVSAGQLLMTIDPKDIAQSVENSSAQYSAAVSNQKLAAENARRYQSLYASGAVSKAMLDQYLTQLDAADASLRQAQAQLSTAQNQLDYTNLRSDVDGVVADIKGEAGQIAAAGTPLITVIQNGEREVQIFIPENKLTDIHIGQKAEITFWALKNLQVSGTIREISPIADPVTKTYQTRVSIDQMPPEAKLGMTAKVYLAGSSENEISIPLSGIYQTGTQPKVWLVENNQAHLQNIKIKNYADNKAIVESGLNPGDTIIVSGINKLVDNQTVRPLEGGEG